MQVQGSGEGEEEEGVERIEGVEGGSEGRAGGRGEPEQVLGEVSSGLQGRAEEMQADNKEVQDAEE